MVASTPEYHILGKRVAVGRLLLGSIIDSLQQVIPLNTGEEPTIDESRIDPFHDKNVQVSVDVTRASKAGVAARVLALEGVGGEINAGVERGGKDVYTIPDVHTWQFDAAKSDFLSAVKAEGVQEYLKETRGAPVFMITGLKVGSNVSIDITKVRKVEGQLKVGVDAGSAVSVGPEITASRDVTRSQKLEEQTNRILAIRVRKLRYKKAGFMGLSGPKKLVDSYYNDGAELVTEKSGSARDASETWVEDDGGDEDGDGDTDGLVCFIEPRTTPVVPRSIDPSNI